MKNGFRGVGRRRSLLIWALTTVLLAGCSTAPILLPPAQQAPAKASGPFEPPQLSVAANEANNLAAAYGAQKRKVDSALMGRAPSGFKAGLTTLAGQQRFGLRGPVAGVLWPDTGLIFNGDITEVNRSSFRKPMLEMELAFKINTLIPEQLADVSEVQYVVSEIMPAVELPDLGFDSEVGITGEAIVAANVGARYYVLGAPLSVDGVDVNAVRARLHHDGKFIERGEATQVMGNQWRALFWMINTLVEQGWVLQPGQVLLTGAMGEMTPLEAGIYEARFSGLGEIRLQVN